MRTRYWLYRMHYKHALALLCVLAASGQTARKPFQARASSTISLANKAGSDTLEITNVSYEVISTFVTGRPKDEQLLLRTTTSSKVVLDQPGAEATTTLETWPLGASLSQKPLYTIRASGSGGRTVDGELFVIDRGLEDVEWWSVYQLGSGQHLFDTYVPLIGFSISREVFDRRYIGLEIPPDDSSDRRLKQPNVVGVVTYASAAGKKQEALLTCDDAKQAQALRSYADATRSMSLLEGPPVRGFRIAISQNAPSAPNTITLTVPIAGDDLDVAHAVLPKGLHLARWTR
jgi:hypothetical protein